jgi:electron transport complex protein RnfG
MFKDKIKPPLVLTLICLITCGLLVAAYEATYVDNTGVMTDKLIAGINDVYGPGAADAFEIVKNEDGSVLTFDGVSAVLSDGRCTAFEVTADGYSSGGLHCLVGLDAGGTVWKVAILTIGETPGLGTKVQDAGFLSQFRGVNSRNMEVVTEEGPADAKAVWGSREEIDALATASVEVSGGSYGFTLDAVTGATKSSNGVYTAVKTALAAYQKMIGGETNG